MINPIKRVEKLSKKDIINPNNKKTERVLRTVLYKSEERQEKLLKRAAKL